MHSSSCHGPGFSLLFALVLVSLLAAAGCRQAPLARLPSRPPDPAIESKAKPYPSIGNVERIDPSIGELIPPDARIEVLASGFEWTEGPVWIPARQEVLFSDIPRNSIFAWSEARGARLFLRPSGFSGGLEREGEPGSNGLLLDAGGHLVICEHGDRQVTRLEKDGVTRTVLAGHFGGKRLNSPNDAVFRSDGSLYFTDPPYGLPKGFQDPAREIDFCGVYRVSPAGEISLLTADMTRPNGIGFSPDEKTLYIANSDPRRAVWMAFPVADDGALGEGRVFFDATRWVGELKGLPDGLAIDEKGNLFATGPGGVLVLAPDGTHLGTIATGEATSNCTFGDDGRTLYITADMHLCRIRTNTKGLGF
ncbi:MAG: SMP-30/gluconolactonase/LRE family protein [Planctomycetes bacterium]|nr:SMP-30/gluconolactonase/LRE family protein [Planctomycetota bacterium]